MSGCEHYRIKGGNSDETLQSDCHDHIYTVIERISLAADRHEIAFPDLPGYTTLKCDLHMHTVFSDGLVWPTARVDEAWGQGLDAIAISDHIEDQPHKDDIPTKHNRPFELAAESPAGSLHRNLAPADI